MFENVIPNSIQLVDLLPALILLLGHWSTETNSLPDQPLVLTVPADYTIPRISTLNLILQATWYRDGLTYPLSSIALIQSGTRIEIQYQRCDSIAMQNHLTARIKVLVN